MSRFNLDDYAPVEERIGMFYSDHPEGRILTAVERLEPPLVVFRAEVYRDGDDERPWASGYAYEKEGAGHVNRTSYIENCETSAIGRALANAGYHGKRDGMPRPSREEMEKVERMGSTPATPPPSEVPEGVDVQDMVDRMRAVILAHKAFQCLTEQEFAAATEALDTQDPQRLYAGLKMLEPKAEAAKAEGVT